jgi:DNA processing protein
LAQELAKSGLILSEMPLGTQPLKGVFPRRNRIVAGLSEMTLVVEAEIKSGSLVTASYALEMNREVAAVPGAINTAKSAGCHHLIKQGAALVENAQDVMDLLAGMRSVALDKHKEESSLALSEQEKVVLAELQAEPLPAEVLISRTGLSIDLLNQTLIDLELQGLILHAGGNYQRSAQ